MKVGEIMKGLGSPNSYAAKLRSDQWINYASSIRQSRGNVCQYCHIGGRETHVHHIFYNSELEPWEHPEEDLVLLCHSCHKAMHEQLNNFRRYVFNHFRPDSMQVLNGALKVGLTEYDGLTFAYAIAEMAASPGSVKRFCEAWINSNKKL